MEIQEFRVGNYLLSQKDNTILKVVNIRGGKFEGIQASIMNGELYNTNKLFSIHDLAPIKITLVILSALHFEIVSDEKHTVILQNGVIGNIEWSKAHGYIYNAPNGVRLKMLYLHTLQNLFYALSAEELWIESIKKLLAL